MSQNKKIVNKNEDLALKFLTELFGDKPDKAWIYLWRLKGKKSTWFQDVQKAATFVNANPVDIYIGCGIGSRRGGPNTRLKAEQVKGIPGFYADIDIAHDVHKKNNLPATVEEAMSLIKGHGFDPTIIIHSGHGLQAWWLFKEPWLFDTDEERKEASRLAERLTETLKQRADPKGWTVDPVHDLARVLRVPGSVNNKQGDKKPVTIIEGDGPRYNPDDFDEFLVAPEVHRPVSPAAAAEAMGVTKSEGLTLSPTAEPPSEKFDILCDIEPLFRETWRGKREFDSGDDSPSSYHMSLAYYAALAGWTDQEIANLLIAWNRRHNITLDKVVGRTDYVPRTIVKARKRVAEQQANQAIKDVELFAGTQYQDKEARRAEYVQTIKAKLGFEVIQIVQYDEDNPSLSLVVKGISGEISLPTIDDLIKQSRLRKHIAAHLDFYIPNFKPAEWRGIAQTLLDLKERASLGPQATLKGKVRQWLSDYLDGRTILDINKADSQRHPFVHNNQWHFFLNKFLEWLRLAEGSFESSNAILNALRKLEVHSVTVAIKTNTGTGKSTRYVYRVPHEVAPPHGGRCLST